MAKMRSMSTGIGSWLSAILVSMCVALAFGVFPGAVNADATRDLTITDNDISDIFTIYEPINKYNCDGNPDRVMEIRITFGPLSMHTDIEVLNGSGGQGTYIMHNVQHTALKLAIASPTPIELEPTFPSHIGQNYCPDVPPAACVPPGPSPDNNWWWLLAASESLNLPNVLATNAAAPAQIVLHPGDANFAFFVGPDTETFDIALTTAASITETRPGTAGGENVTEAIGLGTIEYICFEPEPGLACTKDFDQETVMPGDIITAEATIINTGNAPITVDVTDTLDAGLSFVAMLVGPDPTPNPPVGQTITWPNVGPIPVGDSVTFTYTVSVDAIDPGQTLCNDFYGESTDFPGTHTDHCIKCVSRKIPPPPVPTFTQWGIIGFTLLLSIGGICLIRRKKLMS